MEMLMLEWVAWILRPSFGLKIIEFYELSQALWH